MKSANISSAMLIYFKTGICFSDRFTEEEQCDIFLMLCSDRKLRATWESHKAEVLAGWIKERPCSRPYAFWFLDAPEPRRQVSGVGNGWSPGMGMDRKGLPRYWQPEWNKNDSPIFESQATFLDRHGLLSPVEKAYLAKHPGILEPERIEFKEDEDE
jgi:hypothetical protein